MTQIFGKIVELNDYVLSDCEFESRDILSDFRYHDCFDYRVS